MNDCKVILKELKKGSITADAMWRKYGIGRTGARIFDLRAIGYNIETVIKNVKTRRGTTSRVGVYYLKGVYDE